jgi:TRAP-type mannitol/chloroaromatic compound transport system permease small subunit
MLYGTAFMGAAAYTLLCDEHVRIELIYEKVSPKSRAIIDAIGYLVFFFPSVGALFYFGVEFALKSWRMLETSGESMWSPPIYPFKTIIPFAAFVLILQGVVQFCRCLSTIRRDNAP